jgi:hypothetical protein
MNPLRALATLLGIAAWIALSMTALSWISWLEFSSEAYAFTEAEFAEMHQEHVAAYKLYGSIAFICVLLALVLAWASRNPRHAS